MGGDAAVHLAHYDESIKRAQRLQQGNSGRKLTEKDATGTNSLHLLGRPPRVRALLSKIPSHFQSWQAQPPDWATLVLVRVVAVQAGAQILTVPQPPRPIQYEAIRYEFGTKCAKIG